MSKKTSKKDDERKKALEAKRKKLRLPGNGGMVNKTIDAIRRRQDMLDGL